MEFIPPDIFSAAVELVPAHRSTLNQRKQKAAIHKLQNCSWVTQETFSCASNTAVACVGVILLVLFSQCFLHRWRKYKGTHPATSCCISLCVSPYHRVTHRIDKVWKQQKRRIKKWFFHFCLLYIILCHLMHRKVAKVWIKCKDKGEYYFECMKTSYIRAVLFISSFVRVSAVVIFLHLVMSGDVELNPGPQGQLTVKDLKTVRKAIWDARMKWMDIGVELDLDITDLNAIESMHRGDIGRCFVEMLTLWLKQVDIPPTWSAIVAALREPIIGFEPLAEIVDSKYANVHQSSKASDITNSGRTTESRVRNSHHRVKLEEYAKELKSRCKAKSYASSDDNQWPPPIDDKHKVFRLEIVEAKRKIRRTDIDSDWVRYKTIEDKVDKAVHQRVPIELKDLFTKIEDQPKVLLEGAPGCGKSTLSFHIRHLWANGQLFQEYKLIVLIRLRDLIVQNAKSVADLLRNSVGEVSEEIMAGNGESILLVLDGWDELTKESPGHAVIFDLIKRNELQESSIIITSRPTSSANLHKHVSLRAEILGFSKSELRSYFTFCLKDDPKDVDDLLKRIEDNAILEGICYLPLNASILVHLFICGDGELPNTQYGIFHDLICNCIYRYLKRTQAGATDIPKVKSLSKLPQLIKNHFQQLCKLSYDGIMNDEVIFHIEKPGFVTLDLLQKVESFDRYGGMSYSYNFLHLSIQELLAAVHIATKLENDEQVQKFQKMYNNARFSAVFQFYAAITKLEAHGIKTVIVQVAKRCAVDRPNRTDKALLLSLLHCLYEAQDSSLCQLVADQLDLKLKLGGTTLNHAECFSLQYFIKHLENFEIDLKNCSIDGDKCKALFKSDQAYPIRSLNLEENPLEDEGANIVSKALKEMKSLQHLILRKISIKVKGLKDILSAVSTMTTLQSLNIGNNDSFKDKGVEAVLEAMKKIPNLQHFNLGLEGIGSEAALAILTGMKSMATVPRLNLRNNGAAALSDVLKTMTNIQYLDLQSNNIGDMGVVTLSGALKGMTNLQHLDLCNNNIHDKGGVALSEAMKGMTNLQYLNLQSNFIKAKGGVAISEALGGMINLHHLDLQGNDIHDEGGVALSEALRRTTNLEYLDLSYNYIEDEGAVAISAPLKKMPNLQKLILDANDFGDRGTEALAEAMKAMNNIQVLKFGGGGNSVSYEGAMTILAVIRTMNNLKELQFYSVPLGDDGAVAVLEAVKVMPSLQTLLVYDNKHYSISEIGDKAIQEAEELIAIRKHKN